MGYTLYSLYNTYYFGVSSCFFIGIYTDQDVANVGLETKHGYIDRCI